MEEKIQPINPNPPSADEIEKAIKVYAFVKGETKSEIIRLITDEWLPGHPERIKQAKAYTWTLFNGRETMPRKVVRAGRRENGMTFSQLIKKRFRES